MYTQHSYYFNIKLEIVIRMIFILLININGRVLIILKRETTDDC